MVDFFSDSDDERAVEELLAQAKDMAVLDQIAAIHCASFTNSDLPSHLEARFQKLKSAKFTDSNSPKPYNSEDNEVPSDKCEKKLEPSKQSPESPHPNKIPKSNSNSPSWSSSSSGSASPPAKSGCFLCSPKKVSSKGSKLSKKQQKLIKKAMEEEEKICREAEKIANWATKQAASARMMNFDDYKLSDDEETTKFH